MRYWLTESVRDISDAMKWIALALLGLILLGLDLGLGVAFLDKPIDSGDVLYWVFGGLCLALSLWMRSPGELKIILWASGLVILAFGFSLVVMSIIGLCIVGVILGNGLVLVLILGLANRRDPE